ncbi:MAG: carboxyltransferase domain-containing protein [Microlunatus sp.]
MTISVQTTTYGDAAVLAVPQVELSPADRWTYVHNLTRWLLDADLPGVLDAIPTYDRVLVEIDPIVTDHATVIAFIRTWATLVGDRVLDPIRPGHTYRIPVVYGGEAGPDLDRAAADLGTTADGLIRAHSELVHPIRCLAQAGSPMLDGTGLAGEVARRTDPRLQVPDGAVMLAGRQALIMPVASPSGWQIIGRTPLRLVDPTNPDLLDYRPGDVLSYRRIADTDWAEFEGMPLRDCRV